MANDIDFGIWIGPRSDVNTPFESQWATSNGSAIVMLAISVTVYEIFTVKIWMTLILNFRRG